MEIGVLIMGYESFLMEIHLKNSNEHQNFISDLMKRNFSLYVDHGNSYLEKTYSSGIVELCISYNQITFRYAKPNLKESLTEFLEELQDVSKKYNLFLYDPCTKKVFDPPKFEDVALMFERSHADFTRNYPNLAFPIKSEDVFGIKKK